MPDDSTRRGDERSGEGRRSTDWGAERSTVDADAETAVESGGPGDGGTPRPVPDLVQLEHELHDLRGELSRFERAVEERTVKKPALEEQLERYVRRRMRRNRARGWGPYLVLLYGTVMTLGAFFFLAGGWAILAMLVVWLSTLGLYVVMVAVGAGLNLLGIPGRLRDAIGDRRT